MDRAAADAVTACCRDLPPPHDGAPLCPTWLPWLLTEAGARGVALHGVVPDGDGWRTCSPDDLRDLAPELLRVSRRPGCAGPITRLALTRGGRVVAAALPIRGPGTPEPLSWRALLAEALARDATAIAAR